MQIKSSYIKPNHYEEDRGLVTWAELVFYVVLVFNLSQLVYYPAYRLLIGYFNILAGLPEQELYRGHMDLGDPLRAVLWRRRCSGAAESFLAGHTDPVPMAFVHRVSFPLFRFFRPISRKDGRYPFCRLAHIHGICLSL